MLDAQLDRRCASCKVAMNHTHGAHAVSSQEAAFYCSGKCRRRARRGQQAAGAVARIRLDDEAALYPPSGVPLDWLQLPRNVVKEIQGRLELPDLLQMAQACKAWLSCMADGMTSVALHGCQDTRALSNTVYLLDRLLPAVTSLSLTLPSTEDASRRVQVLSRATRLQHLALQVEGSIHFSECPEYAQLRWLPALARLTRLRSLSLEVPEYFHMVLDHLAPLTALTRLCLRPANGIPYSMCHDAAAAVDVLAALPLEHLQLADLLLPTAALSRLTRLTHLAVTDIEVSFGDHRGLGDMGAPAYLPYYCSSLARLPCLQTLALGTQEVCSTYLGRVSPLVTSAATASLLRAASESALSQAHALQLDIGTASLLQAVPDSMTHLGHLTNLTSLRLVITSWHESMNPGTGLAALSPLSRLQQLSITIHTYDAQGLLDEETNAVVLHEHQLRAVCLQLQRLTQLRLGLRPCWLWPGPTALRHLCKLRSLRDLSLRLPPDNNDYKKPHHEAELAAPMGLLRAYVPPSVHSLNLVGFQLL